VVARHRARTIDEVASLMNFSVAYVEKVQRQALAKLGLLARRGKLDIDPNRIGDADTVGADDDG
jgi:hypothetical protein